ncbi:MAG: 50S ribosome-binding GTPase, partial [Myxococcales bacterium]|nr:50S ribosome-binding GTPase [Myxococcales bacterium]
TASELLARRLDGRLAQLRRKLAEFERSDSTHRAGREGCARIALVGYTNAGKTSLMNALTAAGLSVRDRPFETLDTTSRSLTRHGGDVLLSDTVGFIRRLPERLFASFESTLAEVSEATLIVLVLDVSDPEIERHIGTTQGVLEKLGAASIPRLVVFNKLDRLEAPPDAAELERLSGGDPHVALSTHDGDAVESLRERLLAAARGEHLQQEIFVPYAEHGLIRSIYGRCRVLEAEAEATGTRFRLEGAPHIIEEIAAAAEGRR